MVYSRGRAILLGVLACLFGSILPARAESFTFDTVVHTGSSSNRVDLVFLGDGYTQDQIETVYAPQVDSVLSYIFDGRQDPYPRYRNFFNVHRINVISAETGADVPDDGIYVDTVLDARYGSYPMQRLLQITPWKATTVVDDTLAGTQITADMRMVTVNSSLYGGSGGSYAVFAGGNSYAGELALHESGHSFAGLADEYGGGGTYSGYEPGEPNVTADPNVSKWSAWVGYDDPDNSLSPVGAYEGARYYNYGIYRPTDTSKMRSLGQPFNAVSREEIIHTIYSHVNPLDDWAGNVTGDSGDKVTLSQTGRLWVDVVDEDVFDIRWSVNGEQVATNVTELDLFALGCGPGTWQVLAEVEDPTDWVRTERELLEDSLAFEVTLDRGAGDVNRDLEVNFADLAALRLQFGRQVTPYTSADFTGDGWVTADDLAMVKAYYGTLYRQAPSPAPVVPEPTGLALLLLGGAVLAGRKSA